jgi:micrococcal nuclease
MYEYMAKVTRVIDGDTVDVDIDLGFRVWVHNRLRLYGIDTPETRTRDLEEKEAGLHAKEVLEELLAQSGNWVRLVSHGLDKYGRSLATIYVQTNADSYDTNVNSYLLKEGLAEPYNP